jgi:ribonuclease BN (tRNA processing enzyme)
MRLTILGASGGFPAPGGATSGYLLDLAGRHILIDCGSGVLANLFRFINISQLDAVILTHLHYDHISDMHVLKYALNLTRRFGSELPPLPVIAPATPEAIAATLAGDGELIIGQISSGSELAMFGARVRFFAMEHPVETYGVSIEHDGRKLALTADSVPCTNLQPLLQDADLALMDAGSIERLRGPKMLHMTAAECATLARACQVKKLVLTHLLPLIDPAEILAEARLHDSEAELACPLITYEV